jgi:putative membrane protein
VPIWFLYDAGRAILGLIPLLIIGGGLSPATIVVFLSVGLVMFIAPAVRYSRFRYDIHGDTLVVEGGLLGRWRRVIPRERVQSIDVVQKLRHRVFGVVELRIEAVGGKQTEAALVAVLPEEAERIRKWASGGEQVADEVVPDDASPPLARLSGKDLLVAGVTGGRVAVLAVLIGYAQELFGDDSFDRITGFAEGIMPGASLVVVISVLVVAALTLSLLLSIALTILIYWDFTLRLQEDRLVITRGLLERRKAQIPLRRVQAIQINENLVRRPFGLASLTVVVAGYAAESQESEESSMLLPLARREIAWRVATDILGGPPDLDSVALERPPSRAVARRIAVPTVFGLALGGAAYIGLGRIGAAAFAFVPLSWLLSWFLWRCSGHADSSGYVLIRSGAMVRKTSIVPQASIQHLQLTWSALQKAFQLATVKVHIPGTQRRASDLEHQDARRWFGLLADARRAGKAA